MFGYETFTLCILFVILAVTRVFLGSHQVKSHRLWIFLNRIFSGSRITLPFVPYLPFIGSSLFIPRGLPIFEAYHKLTQRYGNIFAVRRGNSDVVIVNGACPVREFLSKGRSVASRPLLRRIQIHNPQFLGLADTPYSTHWKEQRKFCLVKLRNMSFRNESFDNILRCEVNRLHTDISHTGGKPFNPVNILQKCVSNVICNVVLGSSCDTESDSFMGLISLIRESLELTTESPMVDDLFWPFNIFQKSEEKKMIKVRDGIMGFIERYINMEDSGETRYNNNNGYGILRAFSDEMSKPDQSQKSFSREQRLYLLVDLFNAGNETTMLTLQWALLYMANNPQVQKKMQTELDAFQGDQVTYDHAPELPYCEAVLLEVQRHASVVPLSLPHVTLDDITICDHLIPANTTVMTNLWSAHQDLDVWTHPQRFWPEHFLSEENKVTNKSKLIQFSEGTRRCVGEHLAKVTLFTFFVNIMKNFTFKIPNGIHQIDEEGVFRISHSPKDFEVIAVPRIGHV